MMNFFTKKPAEQTNSFTGTDLAPACRETQELLSAYVDNSLSARQVWEVEKHLASCRECASVSQQMQATVQLLRGADRFNTSDDFMARLHARLDDVTPAQAQRQTGGDRMREMLSRTLDRLSLRRLPALNLGVAGAGIVALLLLTQRPATVPVAPSSPPVEMAVSASSASAHENLQRNVALTANDPLGDVAAEMLESAEGTASANSPGSGAAMGTNGG